MQRRDFLRKSPGGTFGPLIPLPPVDESPAAGEYTLLRFRRRAMATSFEIALPLGTPFAHEAAIDALDLIDDLEDQLTVYRDDSEVSRLNAAAAEGDVPVETGLFELLQRSVTISQETAGAFDVATGSLIKAWGFYRRAGRVPTPTERAEAMSRTGSRHVILKPELRSVKYRVAGVEINLGGIGKGYALDRAAELLQTRWGITIALLHGGGSSVYALGHPPGDTRGWPIAVRHPVDENRTLGTIRLRDAGFGTSSATFQHFIYNGQKLGHLLDPRTGWPASGTESASVMAPTAAEADALSTAFFVLGADAAADHCRPRPHLAALMLPCDGSLRVVGDLSHSPPTFRETYLNTLAFPD